MKMINKNIYNELGLSEKVAELGEKYTAELKGRFEVIDRVAEYNQMKVLKAMQSERVSDTHFNGSTGYGYNDAGREALEAVYARVFHTETALV